MVITIQYNTLQYNTAHLICFLFQNYLTANCWNFNQTIRMSSPAGQWRSLQDLQNVDAAAMTLLFGSTFCYLHTVNLKNTMYWFPFIGTLQCCDDIIALGTPSVWGMSEALIPSWHFLIGQIALSTAPMNTHHMLSQHAVRYFIRFQFLQEANLLLPLRKRFLSSKPSFLYYPDRVHSS